MKTAYLESAFESEIVDHLVQHGWHHGIQNTLRCGAERLTDKQKNRLDKAFEVDERHEEVQVA